MTPTEPMTAAPTEPIRPSASVPDWTREAKSFWAWNPSRSLLASIRAYQRRHGSQHPGDIALRKFAVLRHLFWSVVTGTDIPIGCRLAGGLLMPHPNGIVIHSDARVGPNCLIFQQVTLGGAAEGAPVIGGNVDIGAGAKILGRVTIGDHALIGANAVVLCDVPGRATAVGVPAKILRNAESSGLR